MAVRARKTSNRAYSTKSCPFFIADEFSDQLKHGFVSPFVRVGSVVSDSLSRPVKDEGEPIPQPPSPSPNKRRR